MTSTRMATPFGNPGAPIGVVQHQLDISALGDDFVYPARVLVMLEYPVGELPRLLVCHRVEVDA